MSGLKFSLVYKGSTAEENAVDLYDGAQALIGFQRSLAITTHLILNGEVITKAPYLKGAKILSTPIEEGSWKAVAVVVGGLWAAGQAPRDSALGHLMISAYDYIVSEALGFHVDFDQTLKKQYDEYQKSRATDSISIPTLNQSKFDSVIEKCEYSLRDLHRPIVWSKTASSGLIIVSREDENETELVHLDLDTYNYISATDTSKATIDFEGYVSSYNINTFKGRIYIHEEGRPIPFELSDTIRNPFTVNAVVESLRSNAASRFNDKGKLQGKAYKRTSPSGRLKGLLITEINNKHIEE